MADTSARQSLRALSARVVLPVVLTVMLFVSTLFLIFIPSLENQLLERRREMTKALTQTAWSMLSIYHAREQSGELTHHEAQARVIARLREMRYGPRMKDYYWINDMHPNMVMHPYRPDLEGQDISGLTDPKGKRLFVAFVEKVKAEGEGFVPYMWQLHDDPNRVVPKISYVKGFEPWGWIIGTGLYVEDVRLEIVAITRKLTLICLGILGVIMVISAFIIWQGVQTERRRRRAEKALGRTTSMLDSILASATEFAIVAVDLDFRIVHQNPAAGRFLGLDGDAQGRRIQDLPTPERFRLAAFGEMAASALEGGKYEFDVERGEGDARNRFYHVVVMPMRDGQQQCVGYVLFAQDVTPRRRAEQQRIELEIQVQHAQKLKDLGVLAGGVAHDFNNLLTSVLGNADLAMMDLSPVSTAQENIKQIQVLVHRASDLCRQMLAYAGKGKFVTRAVDLNDVVREMAQLLEVSISKKAVLKYDFSDNLPAIEADPTQISQIVMNLITNASEAIGKRSGAIVVRTGAAHCDRDRLRRAYFDEHLPEGLYVSFEVGDTGCGMSKETIDRMFDPFFTTKVAGRGLGMAAVMGIIRGHKGVLEVKSELGKGSTFRCLFPAVDRPAEPLVAPPKEFEAWRGSGTVLLVDDEETIRAVGRQMLERLGFDVLTAADGREAIRVFQEHAPEIACVLLDLTMPEMDGEEAFRALREIRADVPVILSSGYGEQEVIARFSGTDLTAFIEKPYGSKGLIPKIREVMSD
ncbi:MAG: cache domain-containing protein [Phycisphaerae bacterium]|nr:cache domain-containing protein [Phycisphaerae bacterium]